MPEALYVILRHEGVARPHFDLMFQTAPGSTLATWRSDVWPPVESMVVEELGDHRQVYLTFEGEISGGRGHVRRMEQGICHVTRRDDNWTIQLKAIPSGEKLTLQIKRNSDGKFILSREPGE